MRVLLSTIGTRGDVQPLVALALELRDLGQQVHLCAPPDFRAWIDGLALPVTPIGPPLRTGSRSQAAPSPPSPQQLRQLARDSVTAQFETVAAAAKGCDVIVAATALQVAARSVAELMDIPYVFAAYCPAVLPSAHHAPPVSPVPGPPTTDNGQLWARDAALFNGAFGDALNAHRTSVGLDPVDDVRGHIFTDRPWLAADQALAPWPEPTAGEVVQTGAWMPPDRPALPAELVAFLEAGEPPVYFGFGSSAGAPEGVTQAMIESARAHGRRVIVSRGWAGLSPDEDAPDCLSIGDVNHQALFTQVAAVVHHGGAGTTTTAARAGAPQVIIPQAYDQYYWAQRVDRLGIGTEHPQVTPTAGSLATALDRVLRADVAARARAVAATVRTDGARVAARRLMAGGGSTGHP
ncbi:glycosyltransferase [Nonomuraea glycinis]|uniref:glycosyltransferase n=1 Tax=Nonomuraea glycinis TaxID=2047744 RepID=UPI0016642AB9|nr:glycosyltransferase [Nonomuraea glycinis]MCA2181145.1 glycosyltransferase [Nonomuraea glycinis]